MHERHGSPSVTFAFTCPIEQVPEGKEVEHSGMVNMAAGWHRVGLERPHFVATETVAVGSSPTNGSRDQYEACCAAMRSENPDRAAEEGKNYFLQLRLLQVLQPVARVISLKRGR